MQQSHHGRQHTFYAGTEQEPLQSPLSSLARQASLSLRRKGSSTSHHPRTPIKPSEQDDSYFAPILAESQQEVVATRESDARASTYSEQTDPVLHNVIFIVAPRSHSLQQKRLTLSYLFQSTHSRNASLQSSVASAPFVDSPSDRHSTGRVRSTYRGHNFSRPMRSPRPDDPQQRERTLSGSSIPPATPSSVTSTDELEQRMRANSFSDSPSRHSSSQNALRMSAGSDSRPKHLSASSNTPARNGIQRSSSKDSFHSMQSNASSAYISPTSVQPGGFRSLQQSLGHHDPWSDSIAGETSEELAAQEPPPAQRRPRADSMASYSSRRQSQGKRNSRWKSFFSFRSGKDGDEDDDDDDVVDLEGEETEDWSGEQPSPSTEHVLFRSKHDAPGIVFSPSSNNQDKVVVPLNQASDVNWEELHRRRIAEAEAAAARMRAEDDGPSQDIEHLSMNASILMANSNSSALSHRSSQRSAANSAPPSPTPSSSGRPPSLYSDYSYYELDETGKRSPVPGPSNFNRRGDINPSQPRYDGSTGGTMAKTKRSMDLLRVPDSHMSSGKLVDPNKPLTHEDPMDCLMLGIEQHEKGSLERAAFFFERAATLHGGVGSGMLLWGLSLRHGWGVHADPQRGFRWIQRAAESVVGDLSGIVSRGVLTEDEHEAATSAARDDLVLAIYELGMCFRQGWGVKKDRKLALMYFELAASLGDADAQQELGFCYLKGKGTKVDKMKAAKFFRLAEAQGVHQWSVVHS